VDVFHGRLEGRVLAEIELTEENEPFAHPAWLGEEVTGQPQYYNANM
jgi:CYTH domain-containing protein